MSRSVNMFPHTAHVESVAWFEKTGPGKTRAEIEAIEAAEAAEREATRAAKKAREEAEARAKAAAEAERQARKEARYQHYLANKDYYDKRAALQAAENSKVEDA